MAAYLMVASLSACSAGDIETRVDVAPPAVSQDRLPPRATVATQDAVPFATVTRQRVDIHESVTRNGEPLVVGSIELPDGWSTVAAPSTLLSRCEYWQQCVLWEAVSRDGSARIQLLSPRRAYEDGVARGKSASPSLAERWLRGPEPDKTATTASSDVVAVDAAMPATRKGWATGGARLSISYDAFAVPMRELRALDVETRHEGRTLHRVQSWPMLVLRMPAAHFDADAADAVHRSLHFDPAWVAAWWLGWEARTIREECKRGYRRGMCHIDEGSADYFQSGHSMGLWDTRSDYGYGEPSDEHYDAAARKSRR